MRKLYVILIGNRGRKRKKPRKKGKRRTKERRTRTNERTDRRIIDVRMEDEKSLCASVVRMLKSLTATYPLMTSL
jgi:hypothetical protein